MEIFKILQVERLSSKAGDKLVKFFVKDITTGERSEILKNAKKPYTDFIVGDHVEKVEVEQVLNTDGTVKLNAGFKLLKADSADVALIMAGKVKAQVGEGLLAVQTLKSVTTTVGRIDAPITVGAEDVLSAF